MGGPGRDAHEGDWAAHLRRLIDEGQCFLAYDEALEALRLFPESRRIRLLAALSLVRSSAAAEARRMLEPIAGALHGQVPLARSLLNSLRESLPLLAPGQDEAPALERLTGIAADLVQLGSRSRYLDAEDRDTLLLLAELLFLLWRADGDAADLRRSRDLYLQNFNAGLDYDSGVSAALASWLLGEHEAARGLASALIDSRISQFEGASGAGLFRALTTHGLLLLIRAESDAAHAAFEQASGIPQVPYTAVTAVRERLSLLTAHGLAVPEAIDDLLRVPVVVVFAGQPLDHPAEETTIFPPQIEEAVGRAIRERLEALNPDIGYCSASCGADLLFIEAMIEREAEVHIFLPCAIEDFVAARVAYAGRRWERRFRTALRLAGSVSFATEERYLGHEVLLRFNNQIIDGMARLRSELLGTLPYLMLVWDYAVESRAGTAADFMDHWADIARLRLIDLDDERMRTPPPDAPAPTAGACLPATVALAPERVIKAMLFADIVGFSKLREEELPGLWRFLGELKRRTDHGCAQPALVESWGDALYVVMDRACDLLHYAFALQAGFAAMVPGQYGLSRSLQLRVGLHAGPVYEGSHPLTGRPIVYGSHVSRTARIEPVTVPGEIYGSQQFVALLTSEESVRRYEREMTGEPSVRWYLCEYLGTQQLAKKYGRQPVYHLRPAAAVGPSDAHE